MLLSECGVREGTMKSIRIQEWPHLIYFFVESVTRFNVKLCPAEWESVKQMPDNRKEEFYTFKLLASGV